jgi:hypothetical protein
MSKPLIVHPFLVALAPVCFLLAHNIREVRIVDALPSVGVVLILALVLLVLARFILRQWEKAALLTSLALLLLFTYGHLAGALDKWTVAGLLIGRPRHYLIADAVIFAVGAVLLVRARCSLRGLTRFTSIAAACFVAISLVRVAAYELAGHSASDDDPTTREGVIGSTHSARRGHPDIYYIILDAYGRADVLEQFYGYDNAAFLGYLEQKGFYIATESRANYAYSRHSLASSLNATYLDDLARRVGTGASDFEPLVEMIRSNRVADTFRKQGYHFVVVESGYWPTEIKEADVYFRSGQSLNAFETALLSMTPIPVVLDAFLPSERPFGYDVHRRRILYAFDRLATAPQLRGPVFVFAHILTPHQPFVFDERGRPVTPSTPYWLGMTLKQRSNPDLYNEPYVRQLAFVNAKICETVDAILSASSEPPIIIIQADHGPGSTLDIEDPTNTNMRERMSILNAYYFPDGDYAELYPDITPVNTFRVILNTYFGAGLELLPDVSYFSVYGRPYEFINVTEAAISPDGQFRGE